MLMSKFRSKRSFLHKKMNRQTHSRPQPKYNFIMNQIICVSNQDNNIGKYSEVKLFNFPYARVRDRQLRKFSETRLLIVEGGEDYSCSYN